MFQSLGKKWWKPPPFGWKYFNYAIIAVGLIVGFGVWVMPNNWARPDYQQALRKDREGRAYLKELAAAQAKAAAEQKAMEEELGLIYIEPGTNPFLPPDQQPKN